MNNCLICGKECPGKCCSNKCDDEKRYREYIKKWLNGEVSGNRGIKCICLSMYVIRWVHKTRSNKCEQCGFDKPHPRTGTSVLEIHHKDENPENSRPENLELLCPTCHAMSDSRDSKKGNGRRYYREQYHINGRNGEMVITPTL